MDTSKSLELVKFSELQELVAIGSAMKLLIESTSSEQLKTLTLNQLRQWILSAPNLINATGNTPSLGDNSTRLATTQYVKAELGAVNLNPATQNSYGTVRTNTTESVPTVYLKSEVDALIGGVSPITKGGTGATTSTQARTNLEAAKSGINSDITGLVSLNSIPAIIQSAINAAIPVGSLISIAYEGLPTGYLFCDGRAVSRSTYSALFAVLGTTHGIGDGSTTFNLPDYRGLSIFGSGGITGATLPSFQGAVGATGGTLFATLSISNLPSHNHGGSTGISSTLDHNHSAATDFQGSHAHNSNDIGVGNFATQAAGSASRLIPGSNYAASTTLAGTHQHFLTTGSPNASLSHNHTISSQGNGQSFSIVNPFRLAKILIKF